MDVYASYGYIVFIATLGFCGLTMIVSCVDLMNFNVVS